MSVTKSILPDCPRESSTLDTHTSSPTITTGIHCVRSASPGSANWFRDAPVTAEQLLELMEEAGVDQRRAGPGVQRLRDRQLLRRRRGALASRPVYGGVHRRRRNEPVLASSGSSPADPAVSGVRLFAIGNPTLAELDDEAAEDIWRGGDELDLRAVVTILAPQLPGLRQRAGTLIRTRRSSSTTAGSPISPAARRSGVPTALFALACVPEPPPQGVVPPAGSRPRRSAIRATSSTSSPTAFGRRSAAVGFRLPADARSPVSGPRRSGRDSRAPDSTSPSNWRSSAGTRCASGPRSPDGCYRMTRVTPCEEARAWPRCASTTWS